MVNIEPTNLLFFNHKTKQAVIAVSQGCVLAVSHE